MPIFFNAGLSFHFGCNKICKTYINKPETCINANVSIDIKSCKFNWDHCDHEQD